MVFVLKNSNLQQHQTETIKLALVVTAAGVLSFKGSKFPQGIVGTAPANFAQAAIDSLLGSTNEVVASSAFGATALGADAFGLVIQTLGQVKELVSVNVFGNVGASGAVSRAMTGGQTTALTNTLPALAAAQVTANGNIALQAVLAGLDAAPVGSVVQVEIEYYSI
jgi:hypothetical protein